MARGCPPAVQGLAGALVNRCLCITSFMYSLTGFFYFLFLFCCIKLPLSQPVSLTFLSNSLRYPTWRAGWGGLGDEWLSSVYLPARINHRPGIDLFRTVLQMSCSVVWERLLCDCFVCGICLDLENKMNLHLAIKMYCTINLRMHRRLQCCSHAQI